SLGVQAAHLNHQLRGKASDRDESFVREYCEKRGLVCHVGRGDVSAFAEENCLGTEEAARILRYEFLEKTADEIGADRIATAHTADDNAETMLFNLTRGSGLRGLCGIPPVRGRIVRPILTVSSEEVLKYLEEKGIPHVEDETNTDEAFSRNKIRRRVVPELRQLNPSFDKVCLRTAELLRQDEEFLRSLAEDFIEKNFKNGEVSAVFLAELPKPVSSRVLSLITKGEISSRHIEAVLKLASGKAQRGFADIPKMRVAREGDRLIFDYTKPSILEEKVLELDKNLRLSEGEFEIFSSFIPRCEEIHNSFNIFSFKSAGICGNITVGPRLEGEKIRLSGRGCTKSLKKLFSEAGMSPTEKELTPVFRDEKGPIAIFGFGIAERCLPEKGDDIIKIEINKGK
ncbi:MAG: tRNA lysidine(34) synthetase TilS, partial [Clostridiales bacterium]|nr:tRNA lysidine(34) synthetase TilS [Clostridiales bacterium]